MSFSGQSNPPWQRNSINNVMQGISGGSGVGLGGGISSTNSGLPFHQGSQMFINQQQQQPQQNMPFGHSAMNAGSINAQISNNQMFQGGGVSYPQPRTGLNPVAFQNTQSSGGSPQQAGGMNIHTQGRQNYNSIGTVTKISNDCGLVNDEVFFYRSVCKGAIPKLGERVHFEASFSQNSQFKWNASRIQLVAQTTMNSNAGGNSGSHSNTTPMNQPPPLMSQNIKGSGYNAVPPPNEYQRGANHQRRSSPRRSSPTSDRHSKRDRRETNKSQRSRDEEEDENDRKRRREDRERSKERNRGRHRDNDNKHEMNLSVERRDRERERDRGRSPARTMQKGPRTRSIPRYKVQIPKTILTFKSADAHELRQRYSTLYIPSDFFHTEVKWSESFTPNNPFSVRRPCSFHIMHKVVEPLTEQNMVLDADDADYLFSAKVMLMACPPISEMYNKCIDKGSDNENDHNHVHPSRLISFLVGTRGRNEPMAIGGPWSPSLDGANPEKDPSVLIRTAIRTCKELTGIDLSHCTQWYRFLELYYHRSDYPSKGKTSSSSARVETVVIYLPDINSCLPTRTEWLTLSQNYKTAVENILNRTSTAVGSSSERENSTGTAATAAAASLANISSTNEVTSVPSNSQNGQEKDSANNEATHYSNLDPKSMKMQDIRNELIARNLSSKGLKPQVTARLIKALNIEKSQDKKATDVDLNVQIKKEVQTNETADNTKDTDVNQDAMNVDGANKTSTAGATNEDIEADEDNDAGIEVDMSDILILDEYDSRKNAEEVPKEMQEREKSQLQRRYTLPESSHIIVHPSKTAKGGKFDCSVMSLSVLLDYRPEDTKERLFEVSLFAEIFNEMLMRDFGFNIFKELYFLKDPTTTATDTEDSVIKKEESKPVDEDAKDSSAVRGNDQQQQKSSSSDRKQTESSDKYERRTSKRSVDVDIEDDTNSTASVDRKRKTATSADKKAIIAKPQLLLSFIYFDTSHCGYIFEKDLEDLFSILGLNLSRGQIRKVLGKSISRHALYYRKLTDKDEKTDSQDVKEDENNILEEDLKRIAMGNKAFLPIFKTLDKSNGQSTVSHSNDIDSNGMTTYQGAVVHVGKLVDQIKRSEKAHSELEKLYNDLRIQHTELQSQNTKANVKIKDLQSELKGLDRKLSDTDKDLFLLNRKFNDQFNTLTHIYEKISPIFARSSDKSHKSSSEGSRDRDSGRDKEKEKERTKEKEREKEKHKETSDNEDETDKIKKDNS